MIHSIKKERSVETLLNLAARIKLIVFDVDGVLTDRKIYFSDTGQEYKAFNTHDGFGIKLLISTGVEVGIITARRSTIVERRMSELGVTHVYQGQEDKRDTLQYLMKKLQITTEEVAYVGDDLADLPLIRHVGLGIAVADAPSYICESADLVTKAAGGKGAAREVCEWIMRAQGTLDPILQKYGGEKVF